MKTLHFEGHSDDTFGEYNVTNEDHDNCANGKPIWFLVKAGDDELFVVGQYCPFDATGWMIGVAKSDEDDEAPMPDWPMRFERSSRGYSPRLVIEAPDDVKVFHYTKKV